MSSLPTTEPAAARRRQRPRGSASYLRSHWNLLWRSTRNEIRARYAGSILGGSWVFIAPGLLLTVYGLVYLAVFRVHTPGLSSAVFVLYVFAGLVPFLVTAEALTQGANSVVTNRSLLTNTVFPIDLAPVRAVLAATPILLVGTSVVVVGSAIAGRIDWPLVLLPVVMVLQVLSLIGVTWFLSLVTVVARDFQHVLAILILILLIASPIAYTTGMIDGPVRILIYVNPLAWFVLAYQKIIVLGESPAPIHWAGLVLAGLGVFFAGSRFFSWAKGVALDYV
jgi:homopolymeric O-antigen transport system permease protein